MEDSPRYSEDEAKFQRPNEIIETTIPIDHSHDRLSLSQQEKGQFRRAWEKLFGDIANTIQVLPESQPTITPFAEIQIQPNSETRLQTVVAAAEQDQPIEKLNELRHENKDTPNSIQGATSVAAVMAEALQQRQDNVQPQLATIEGLSRAVEQQNTNATTGVSLYRKAIILGVACGVIIVIAIAVYTTSK